MPLRDGAHSIEGPTLHQNAEAIELSDVPSGVAAFPDQTLTGPPIDGGRQAWRLLLAAFVFESLLWGFPVSNRFCNPKMKKHAHRLLDSYHLESSKNITPPFPNSATAHTSLL